ncbi:hypothetical protein Y032_0367g39 [Ancylostoma ceylanicum]|uniref:Uncharacterized protein n=1 Tax=Ancylostoma ceylanicum TaxID=53326 RepID=A0A016RUQ0_9BILA|nr:hypothetical protein Y032_0367g39 [Ancylostoma ceylanicum]
MIFHNTVKIMQAIVVGVITLDIQHSSGTGNTPPTKLAISSQRKHTILQEIGLQTIEPTPQIERSRPTSQFHHPSALA